MSSPVRDVPPDLSIIIVNRNTRDLLRECLLSIQRSPESVRHEVVVVDNGSTDGSPQMVEERFPGAHLLRNPVNTGYAYPNNQGLSRARGRYVLLLNSDTEVRPGALSRLVEFMDAHPRAGACGPALFLPGGEIQRSCYSFPSPRTYLSAMLTLDRVFPRSRVFGNQNTGFAHDRTARVDALIGAALVVRREVVESVGPLDERFRLHFNDFDWCYRIHRAGWEIWFLREAEVVHHWQATTKAENRDLRLEGEIVRNLLDYHRKHFGRWGVLSVRLGMLVGWGGRQLLFSLLGALRGRREDPSRARYRRGMVRAALTGDPGQFGGEGPPAGRG